VLPRLIAAARVKRLELLKAREERELTPLNEALERTHGAFQEAEENLRVAQNERNLALQNWQVALRDKTRIDERIKRLSHEIDDVRTGAA
jgi:hypothetical protein